MRKNKLKEIWANGDAALNCFLSIPHPYVAELVAHQGFDCLTVDLQHSMQDISTAAMCMQAIATTDVVPLARASWLDPAAVMIALDRGAYGVICPLINNRADAELFVSYCRYPPDGDRSFGPIRGTLYGGADYPDHANEEIVTIGMIETQEALDNLDDIMSTPGLDGVYIGPADLALNLGFPAGFLPDEPKILAAFDLILETAQKHGIVAGTHTGSAEMAIKMVEKGFQLVTVLNEGKIMADALKSVVQQVKAG